MGRRQAINRRGHREIGKRVVKMRKKIKGLELKGNEKENFSDILDVLRHISDIKLRLKEEITQDYVLAKLGDKDKEGAINMTEDAYFCQMALFKRLIRNAKMKQIISDDEEKYIEELGNRTFDMYMNKIHMTIVLNRNVDKNYLINVLAKYQEEEEVTAREEERTGVMSKLKSLLSENETRGTEK